MPEKTSLFVMMLGGVVILHITYSSDEQLLKALSPISVMLEGNTMLVKPELPKKALAPIDTTSSGMIVFLQPANNSLVEVEIMALQPLRES